MSRAARAPIVSCVLRLLRPVLRRRVARRSFGGALARAARPWQAPRLIAITTSRPSNEGAVRVGRSVPRVLMSVGGRAVLGVGTMP